MTHTPDRREFLTTSAAAVGSLALAGKLGSQLQAAETAAKKEYQVGAYYFPNYHVDPRNVKRYGKNWSEWELVKRAESRFPGHRQPRVPAWGYTDEADPKAMAQKIDAAADHGLDYWIFDWYWYNDGPFLERGLEQGFFGAANHSRMKFCCMWANHDWVEIFPSHRGVKPQLLYPGDVTRETFDKLTDHVVNRYFKHPSHWMVDGCPYFSIYDLGAFLKSFGSVEGAVTAVADFRRKTKAAGFPDLHLNAVVWGNPILPLEKTPANPVELVTKLGFNSVTSYVWIHHVPLNERETDYGLVQEKYFEYWTEAAGKFPVPYYPNVSVGWDSSPRTVQSDEFGNWGYPFTNTISGSSPARFREALLATRQRMEANPQGPKILNINSWNEWTEGSYLEPDTHFGLGYLEAIRDVFG